MTDPVAQATDARVIEEGVYIDGEMDASDLRAMLFRLADTAPIYIEGRRCIFAYTYNGKVYLESEREGYAKTPTKTQAES